MMFVLIDCFVYFFFYFVQNANLTGGGNATIDELVNEYHRPIAAPNTFHLEGLLTGLRLADDITDNTNKHGRLQGQI